MLISKIYKKIKITLAINGLIGILYQIGLDITNFRNTKYYLNTIFL